MLRVRLSTNHRLGSLLSTPPVVFVHGLIGTLQFPEFAARVATDALAPDLLGYGTLQHLPAEAITVATQVEHLRATIDASFPNRPVTLVGHSVGGVVAVLLADAYPARVASVVSIEGNFTLKDAFWSSSVARMSPDDAEALMDGFRTDPSAWLARSGVPPTARNLAVAARWLAQQPGRTVRAMAQTVVAVTEAPAYLARARRVFTHCPVHLMAGERSRPGWDIPEWALERAASTTVLPDTGHMMMVEDTDGFVAALHRILA